MRVIKEASRNLRISLLKMFVYNGKKYNLISLTEKY